MTPNLAASPPSPQAALTVNPQAKLSGAKTDTPNAKAASRAGREETRRSNRRLRIQQVHQAQVRQAQQAPRPGQRQDRQLRSASRSRRPSLFQGALPPIEALPRNRADSPLTASTPRVPASPAACLALAEETSNASSGGSSDFKRSGGDFKRPAQRLQTSRRCFKRKADRPADAQEVRQGLRRDGHAPPAAHAAASGFGTKRSGLIPPRGGAAPRAVPRVRLAEACACPLAAVAVRPAAVRSGRD